VARRCWWALVPIVCCLPAGCFTTESVRTTSALPARYRPALDPQAIIIDFALIERAVGDPYINRELWTHTDQLVVDLEKKDLLEANGLRVGQLVGLTPADLQTLLASERWCPKPFKRITCSGQPYNLHLGPVLPHCDYDLCVSGQIHEVRVDRARFGIEVLPALAADRRTKLVFTPKVETGEQVLPFQPLPEQSRWDFKIERPSKAYKDLSWEVSLAPNEFLVIGAVLDKPNSLGYRSFVQDEGPDQVQRLLVIRTNRSLAGEDEPTFEDIARAGKSPPLALQATMGAIRGSRP
jgi:hypothetical protein